MRFISMYGVLNTLSEYTYFYISKNITWYTFLIVFKIAENLQFDWWRKFHAISMIPLAIPYWLLQILMWFSSMLKAFMNYNLQCLVWFSHLTWGLILPHFRIMDSQSNFTKTMILFNLQSSLFPKAIHTERQTISSQLDSSVSEK